MTPVFQVNMAGIMKSERGGWGPDAEEFRPERHLGNLSLLLLFLGHNIMIPSQSNILELAVRVSTVHFAKL